MEYSKISRGEVVQALDFSAEQIKKYLPQFSEKIQELKAAGVHTEDPVVEDLMKHGR